MNIKLTKMVYIASPYSSKLKSKRQRILQQEERFNSITRIIGELHDIFDYAFIGPITQSHLTVKHRKKPDTGFKMWAKIDFTYISRCDELWVVMLPGWKESHGVKEETLFCRRNKIEVKFLNPKTLQLFDEDPFNEIEAVFNNCS